MGAIVEPGTWTASTRQPEREAEAYLERQAARLDGNAGFASYEVRVAEGQTAVRQMLETFRPSDLVVMTTRGRSGLTGRLLGSASASLVERATVPVVLVRAASGMMERALAGLAE